MALPSYNGEIVGLNETVNKFNNILGYLVEEKDKIGSSCLKALFLEIVKCLQEIISLCLGSEWEQENLDRFIEVIELIESIHQELEYHFYWMENISNEEVKKNKDSYIFVNNELQYIDYNGKLETVELRSPERFLSIFEHRYNEDKKVSGKLTLSVKDFRSLIKFNCVNTPNSCLEDFLKEILERYEAIRNNIKIKHLIQEDVEYNVLNKERPLSQQQRRGCC